MEERLYISRRPTATDRSTSTNPFERQRRRNNQCPKDGIYNGNQMHYGRCKSLDRRRKETHSLDIILAIAAGLAVCDCYSPSLELLLFLSVSWTNLGDNGKRLIVDVSIMFMACNNMEYTYYMNRATDYISRLYIYCVAEQIHVGLVLSFIRSCMSAWTACNDKIHVGL